MAASVHANAKNLLGELLRDVSRSFYLTLRILPGSIRDQIGLAYLLARASDTIADTEAVPVAERLGALREFRSHLTRVSGDISLPRLASSQGTPAERLLLDRVNDAFQILFSMPSVDGALIRNVLQTITEGQEQDLLRFHSESAAVRALKSAAELDHYTFQVAGCVGEFWTRICLLHVRPLPRAPADSLVERGIRFGKGLQLVNILRDLPGDLRQGRCYLAENDLNALELTAADLLNPVNEKRVRPLYDSWLVQAREHLRAGWSYTLDLPRSWVRVRLACAWPVLIGFRTIEKLENGAVLNPDSRIKVSRSEVKSILRRTVIYYPFKRAWERLGCIS